MNMIHSEINSSTVNTNKTKSKYISLIAFLIILLFLTITTYYVIIKPDSTSNSSSNKIISKDSYESITKKIQNPDNIEKIAIINLTNDLNTKQHSTEKIIPATKPVPVIAKAKINKPLTKEKVAKESILKTSDWILAQEPSLFTIQIMAAKDEDAIDRFLKLNTSNQNQIAYYKMNSKKDIWYKFISGKYKTLEKAQLAINNLPEKLKNLGPWPRQFRSIQNEIDQFLQNN